MTTQETDSPKGLYQLRGKLLIDPAIAIFPNRCLYTNEPVDYLSWMKLANVEAIHAGPILATRKEACYIQIPISEQWRNRKAKRWRIASNLLKLLGATMFIGGFVTPMLVELTEHQESASLIMAPMLGGTFLLVGCCIPYLDDTMNTDAIYNVGFLKSGKIVLPNVSKMFLQDLPEAKTGLLHGMLGAESIKMPDA